MALLFRNRALLVRRLLPSKILSRDTGYIVLIPEIGEDLPEKGSLLQSDGLPEFSNISVEKCMAAIGVQALEFEKGVNEIEKRTEQVPDPDVFIHIFQPLDILGAPLDATWGLSKTLYLGNNTSMPTNNYLAIHEHAKRARASKFNSKIIYNLSKKDLLEKKNKSNEEARMVKKFVLEGKLNGLELDENKKAQLTENRKRLLEEKGKFKIKIETATKQFKHIISDFSIVRDFPEDLLKNMAVNSEKPNQGPWEVRLLPHIYPRFMEHCPDRNLRFNAWLALVTRGAIHRSKDLATSVHVEQIRFLRRDQANILGYETYADLSMETKMATSTLNIKNVVRNLLQVAKPAQDAELNNLYEFAKGRGFDGTQLELWDIPYWSRKQQKTLSKYQEGEEMKYFPLDTVLNGLFRVCEKLFDIQIASRQGVSVWHKDVKFYDIFEKNSRKPTSGFYLDLFVRNDEKPALHLDKNWMVAIQNRSQIARTMPLAALIFNFRPTGLNQRILLGFKDVEVLFNKFGHALQHLLTRTTYAEVAGVSNIEWDVVETSGHVFSYLLNNRSILRTVSGHHETGDVIPDDLANSIFECRKLTAGLDLCRDMYLSALDIELYTTKEYWLDAVKRLWPEFRSFPLDKLDSHPCSFSQIFSEDWAAAYYSHLWSRMIAADIYSAFYEARNDEDQIRTIGKRFRDTYLALGGSCNPNEVFRLFRGRDPSHKALLRILGLKKDQQMPVKQ